MKIGDILSKEVIAVNLEKTDKQGAVEELVDLLIKAGKVSKKDRGKIIQTIMEREELGSTGIGQGVAIPHGKCDYVDSLVAVLGISKKGVEFDSLDGEPVYILFLLLATTSSAGPHLKALAKVSRLLKDKFFREKLMKAKIKKEVIDIIVKEEQRAY